MDVIAPPIRPPALATLKKRFSVPVPALTRLMMVRPKSTFRKSPPADGYHAIRGSSVRSRIQRGGSPVAFLFRRKSSFFDIYSRLLCQYSET